MKKTIVSLTLAAILVTILFAEERLFIYRTDSSVTSYSVSAIDSIKFADNQTAIQLFFIDKNKTTYPINEIDSLVFAGTPDTV